MNRSFELKAQSYLTASTSSVLQGAIDLHCHCYPEISLDLKARMDDAGVLELARDMGMRGLVLKSQIWPTTGRTYYLNRQVSNIEAIGSITLNPVAGGLNPWVVEVAAKQGAKVVWMPTWSSANGCNKGFGRLMKAWFPSLTVDDAVDLIDSSGQLLSQVRSIISLAKEMDLVVCTGHISPRESLAVASEAEKIGFSKLVFTHPFSISVDATVDEMKEMIKRGGYVEMCASDVFMRNQLDRIMEFIADVGTDRCILSTDAFGEWAPPPPEYLRMFLGRMLLAGVDGGKIRTMVRDNPSYLLGLSSGEENAMPQDG